MAKRILVIGATSSLAVALCRELARQKCHIVLAGRDMEELERLAEDLITRYAIHASCILIDLSDLSLDMRQVINKSGTCDEAYMLAGDMGNDSPDDLSNLEQVIRVNFTAPAQLLAALANDMQQHGAGKIAVISSVAGDRGRQSNYPYGSAKAGLTAFASGLRNRLHDSGVHIMTVKPGFIDTPMTFAMESPLIASREYAARRIVNAMRNNKDILYVPWFWRYIMLIICHIPESIFKKLKL